MTNCKKELDFRCSEFCVISEVSNTAATATWRETKRSTARFKVDSTRLYVSVVTLSINDNIQILETLKQGFKRKISWNKYRCEITRQHRSRLYEWANVLE